MTRRFRLALSGAFALLAAVLCASYGQHVRDEAERVRTEALERYGGEVASLVVAAEGLEAGDVVDRQNVVERDWLVDLAPADAVTGLDSVLGAQVTVPVARGVPLTALNFRDDAAALEVPSGRVALSVSVTERLGVPPTVAPGTELAAYEVRDGGVRLVAEGLQVLRAASEQAGLGSKGALVLAVAPDDVAGVLAASAEGTLRLALPAEDVSGLPPGAGGGAAGTAPGEVPAEADAGGGLRGADGEDATTGDGGAEGAEGGSDA